jgi:hypothetical protein
MVKIFAASGPDCLRSWIQAGPQFGLDGLVMFGL